MLSTAATEALTALDSALNTLAALDTDTLTVAEHFQVMLHLETATRRQIAISHTLAGSLAHRDEQSLGGICHKVIADVLRITPRLAARRLRHAARLHPRTTLTGQVLPPELPATATAWHAGILDAEHLHVIEKFLTDLPEDIHPDRLAKAETFLAEQAAQLRPDQLAVLADRLAITLNPDGTFTDSDRARKRGFTWCGPQRRDGTSVGRLIATPELRATIDALFAKFAAPGMCTPADPTPTVNTEPTDDTVTRDQRTHAQRQHDALGALLRDRLGDPTLGQHHGLPVTIIASTTVEALCNATGHAVTAAGTTIPMPDLIRLASHAWHYLCIYDNHTARPLYLGRTKRIASADQRVVLYERDRGCTAPGCDMPGYLTEVHHTTDWANGGPTDIDQLTLACKPHHRLLTHGGWTTRTNPDGSTAWIPPPQLPIPRRTNDYHHPERLLPDDDAA